MSETLIAALAALCAAETLALPWLVRRIRARPPAASRAPLVAAVLFMIAAVAVFAHFTFRERRLRHDEFRAIPLGVSRAELIRIWGEPSNELPLELLERRWGYRAVEERGARSAARTYAVWWGRIDITTARVAGFDEEGTAVLLSWGGT